MGVESTWRPLRRAVHWVLGLTAVLVGFSGCTSQNHTPAVWLDASFDELHKAFGDPAAVLINNDNNRVYAFRDNPRQGDNGSTETTQLTYGDGQITVKGASCVVLFELAGQSVTGWDWQGEDCGERAIPLPYQVRIEGLDRRSESNQPEVN